MTTVRAPHRGHTALNVLGLALGMTFFLFLLLFVRSELSYDRFHAQAGRIYRVTQTFQLQGQPVRPVAITPLVLAPTLRQEMPEVAEAALVMPFLEGSVPGKAAVRHGSEAHYETFAWADEGLPRILSFDLVEGEAATAFKTPNTLLLSRSAARRYFGDAPALGKVLTIDSGFTVEDYRVSGVFRDFPYNSHLHFDLFTPFASLDHVDDPRILRQHWWANDAYTYVLLADGAEPSSLAKKLPAFVKEHYPPLPGIEGLEVGLHLQPVEDIHLHSHSFAELEENGDAGTVRLLAILAGVVLLLLCINFALLAAAGHEAAFAAGGVRPAAGRLFGRSLAEAGAGMVLALVLMAFLHPWFVELTGKSVPRSYRLQFLVVPLAVALLCGVIAGGTSAWRLARSARALRPAGQLGRQAVVAVELALAVVLLAGAGVVCRQVRFLAGHDLGFAADRVVAVPLRGIVLRDRLDALKAAMEKDRGVLGSTFTSLLLGRKETPLIGVSFEGVPKLNVMATLIVDPDFFKVFELKPVAGRTLSRDVPTDAESGFVMNESAVSFWGLESAPEAVGKKVVWNGTKQGTIVGVVPDFHHKPLELAAEPLLLHIRPLAFRYMYLKLAPEDYEGTLRRLAGIWHGLVPDRPFESLFLREEYERAGEGERRLGRVAAWTAGLALLFACLGLLSLAPVGSSSMPFGARVKPLLRRAAALVAVACILGWPVAYLLASRWLARFGTRADLPWTSFLAAGLIALVAAGLAVSYQALRQAGAAAEASHQG